MRPISHRQSALRAPLNNLLATEANVRILRALVEARGPLNAGELAARTQLGRTSVYPAAAALDETGIIQRIGAGAHRLMQLNDLHPLAAPIRALFDAERARIRALAHGVRDAANELSPKPAAVWIEAGTDQAGDSVRVRVRVLERARGDETAEQLQHALAPLERKLGVTIEVSGGSRAELERIARRAEHPSPRERRERVEWDRLLTTRSTVQLRRLLTERPQAMLFLGVLPRAQ